MNSAIKFNFTEPSLNLHLLEQQKQHTKAIIETQEQERTRIARDLHDGIGQTLAGIIAGYEQLDAEINSFSEEKQKKFRHTAKSLDDAYKELRAISHLMMPRALKVAGLSAAISDLLDKTLANTSIAYSFEKQNTENISESMAIGIYRIFQELLGNTPSNILRRAKYPYSCLIIRTNLFCLWKTMALASLKINPIKRIQASD